MKEVTEHAFMETKCSQGILIKVLVMQKHHGALLQFMLSLDFSQALLGTYQVLLYLKFRNGAEEARWPCHGLCCICETHRMLQGGRNLWRSSYLVEDQLNEVAQGSG